MEKETTRGRTRRKQPSRVAGFLRHEGRRWFAAALSLCLILNNMASVTWAAEAAPSAEKENFLFKLTSSSLYEALQEAIREGNIVDEQFLFKGEEKDVAEYEKLLSIVDGVSLDDGLYELKPEFVDEDKERDEDDNDSDNDKAKEKKEVELRIFASTSWEVDPDEEYEIVGDEKIIFYLSNSSETEQTATIQVDEQKTEEIVIVPKSSVIVEGEGEEGSADGESAEDGAGQETLEEDGENGNEADETEQEEGKKPVSGGGSGAGGNGGNGSSGGSGSSGSSGSSDGTGAGTDSVDTDTDETKETAGATEDNKAEVEEEKSSEQTGKDDKVNETNGANESTESKTESAGNKADKNEVDKNEADKAENTDRVDASDTADTSDTADSSDEKGNTGKEDNSDKGNSSGSSSENGAGQENSGSDEGKKTDSSSSSKEDKAESSKPEKNDTDSSKSEGSEKNNTESSKAEKPEKTESDKSGNDKSGSDDSSKSSSDNSSKSGSDNSSKSGSDNSGSSTKDSGSDSDNKTEVSAIISRNRIRLVADNLEGMEAEGEVETEVEAEIETEKEAETEEETEADEVNVIEEAEKTEEVEAESSETEEETEETTEAASSEAGAEIEETQATAEETLPSEAEKESAETEEAASSEAESEKESEETAAEETVNESETNQEEVEETTAEAEETTSAVEDDDKEIEGELYEAVAVEEKSVIVFVTTAKELGLDNAELRKASPSNAERVSPAYEAEVELENAIVQVKAPENVLPEGVTLQVKELKQEGEHAEKYEEAKEALDNQGTQYDEMMAFDICFIDKKGREIEPDGNVRVSIRVKKEALTEEADLESFSVQHLVEEEGEIFVEEVADSGNKTEGTIAIQAEEHVEAEFEVDSFSIFTVTWDADGPMAGALTARFTCNYLDIDKEKEEQMIPEELLIFPDEIQDGANIIIEDKDLSGGIWELPIERYFASSVEGYIYQYMHFSMEPHLSTGEPGGTLIKGKVDSISIKANNGYLPYVVTIVYEEETGEPTFIKSYCGNAGAIADIKLDIYYAKNEDENEGTLVISNTVTEDGLLTARYSPIPEGAKFIWYKWKENESEESAEVVTRRKVTGNQYNMDEDGRWLNAALDEGARCYYKVEMLYTDADGNAVVKKSIPTLINYSDKLENGNFEQPKVPLNFWDQFTEECDELKWKLTSPALEIVGKESEQHNLTKASPTGTGKGCDGVVGNQCAELNAEAPGSLYQDILTIPGSTLYWGLLHRARGPIYEPLGTGQTDTMYVLIMPTKKAEELFPDAGVDYQNKVLELSQQIALNPTQYSWAQVTEITDDNLDWYRHVGEYNVGENQYLTRFFFISGKAAAGPKEGNLLDDISFSTELPPVDREHGNLSITKIIQGLSEEEIDNYNLTLKLTGSNSELKEIDGFNSNGKGGYTKEITLNSFTLNSDNEYADKFNFLDLPLGEYTIEEILVEQYGKPNVSMDEIVPTENGEKVKKTILLTGNELPTGRITLKSTTTTYVEITNEYLNFSIKKIFQNGAEKSNNIREKFKNVKFKLEPVNGQGNSYEVAMSAKASVEDGADNMLTEEGSDVFGIFEFKGIPEGDYFLKEVIGGLTGYQPMEAKHIRIGTVNIDGRAVKGCFENQGTEENPDWRQILPKEGLSVTNEEVASGAILPDTGGPGLAMFERYGWFLLMLALLMAGMEVRCYGERKSRRAAVMQNEEYEEPL